jgi:hypothetical protein
MNQKYKRFLIECVIFFVAFVTLTIIIYIILGLIIDIFLHFYKYQEPIGKAIKVIAKNDSEHSLHRIIHHWQNFLQFGE